MNDLTVQVGDFVVSAMKVFGGIVTYIIDVTQTQQTIRRNYPVIGRFRYLFEHIGEFFSPVFLCDGPRRVAF